MHARCEMEVAYGLVSSWVVCKNTEWFRGVLELHERTVHSCGRGPGISGMGLEICGRV